MEHFLDKWTHFLVSNKTNKSYMYDVRLFLYVSHCCSISIVKCMDLSKSQSAKMYTTNYQRVQNNEIEVGAELSLQTRLIFGLHSLNMFGQIFSWNIIIISNRNKSLYRRINMHPAFVRFKMLSALLSIICLVYNQYRYKFRSFSFKICVTAVLHFIVDLWANRILLCAIELVTMGRSSILLCYACWLCICRKLIFQANSHKIETYFNAIGTMVFMLISSLLVWR